MVQHFVELFHCSACIPQPKCTSVFQIVCCNVFDELQCGYIIHSLQYNAFIFEQAPVQIEKSVVTVNSIAFHVKNRLCEKCDFS